MQKINQPERSGPLIFQSNVQKKSLVYSEFNKVPAIIKKIRTHDKTGHPITAFLLHLEVRVIHGNLSRIVRNDQISNLIKIDPPRAEKKTFD